MAQVDYGYGDASPEYGYGDAAPDNADYGYGDAEPDQDYGYGDAKPDETDYGYGDQTDYGYGDEPKPETQQPKKQAKRRCSVTKYNLQAMAASNKDGEQKKADDDNKTVETSYASSTDGIEDPAAVAAPSPEPRTNGTRKKKEGALKKFRKRFSVVSTVRPS